jgi:hypothetical protein
MRSISENGSLARPEPFTGANVDRQIGAESERGQRGDVTRASERAGNGESGG